VVIWIEDVLYTIYQHSMVKMTVIHLDWLVPYLGATRNGQAWGGSNGEGIECSGISLPDSYSPIILSGRFGETSRLMTKTKVAHECSREEIWWWQYIPH
jgi:hypothetical protein